MKATEAKLLEFLKKSSQFVIPIYQRTYSWTDHECGQLWDDIVRAGKSESVTAHFIGSIVYVEKGLYHVSAGSPLLVIDGQQRLTTVTLLLEAIARAVGDGEPVDGFSAKKIRNYYLLNDLESGEGRFKLLLSQTDKTSLIALLEQHDLPKEHSVRIKQNFETLQQWLVEYPDHLPLLCKGLSKVIVVDISLNRDQDNPQLIFESMNSTGRELSQADLIRNYILMGLEPDLQTRLYEQNWRLMEVDFGQEAYASHFDGFMRHYLTVKTGEIPKISQVYETFKAYATSEEAGNVETLVSDIRSFAAYYCKIALNAETDAVLKNVFHDIRELRVDVAYPLLLVLYHDYARELFSRDDFAVACRLIESYVFRRSVCGLPTNSMNKIFAQFPRALKRDRYLESILAHFLLLPSYRRFPRDDEFEKEIQIRDLYNFRNRSYWLRRLENHGRKERVSVDEYTIEHILPQNDRVPKQWRADLGEDWKRIHSQYLHTLGNLTLTGYNSEYSDNAFPVKRDREGGFRESPLRLNAGLGDLENWDEAAIQKRAAKLARTALKVWASPSLEDDVLEAYRPEATPGAYTLEDHPYLASGPMHDLFESFRKEVLALDPGVTEDVLKLYIAYKAETNFVDVVPQAKRLRLSLNLDFHEIEDGRGLCRDVTGLGRWGKGNVELGLSSADDLPYAIGLIRQALEKQLGAPNDA